MTGFLNASSVVVPAFRNVGHLSRLVESLSMQTLFDFELLIVSDGCAETEAFALDACTPYPLSVLNTQYRDGFGVVLARNAGVRFARGHQVVFMDPDILIDDDAVSGFQKAHELQALLIGSILSVAPMDLETVMWPERRIGFHGKSLTPRESRVAGMDLATAFAAVDRESFLQIGGFDMDFLGQGGSDTDFGLRHSLTFGRVRFLKDTACKHVGLSSGKLHALGQPSAYARTRQKELLANGAAHYHDPANWVVNGGRAFFEGNEEFWQSMVVRLAEQTTT